MENLVGESKKFLTDLNLSDAKKLSELSEDYGLQGLNTWRRIKRRSFTRSK